MFDILRSAKLSRENFLSTANRKLQRGITANNEFERPQAKK
jgi:hypothetical protein